MRGAIACAAFLVTLLGGWMIGTTPFLTDPETTTSGPRSGQQNVGRIVLESYDGKSCTYLAFDNLTRRIGEPTISSCEPTLQGGRITDFSWGR